MPKATLTEVDRRIVVVSHRTEGILGYDVDNAYPQRVENIINSSGTGKLATKMFAKFIFGGGFTDKSFFKAQVNKKGLRADKLLRKFALSMAKFDGAAFHINYNMKYQKIEITAVPFKHVRFTSPENKDFPVMMAALYDDWGRDRGKIDKKEIDYIDFYNPDPIVIEAQVQRAGGWAKYKGQILYWTAEGMEYPLAPGDAILEDMQTDSKAKTFKYRGITSNFMASHVLEVDAFAEPDPDSQEQSEREQFMEVLEKFQGDDDTLKVLLLEKKPGAEPFNLQKVDIQDVDKLYQFTEESVRDNIIRHYLIPPILLMAIPGKMGTSTEMDTAYQIYNANTYDFRVIAEEVFTELFKDFYINLNTSGDFSVIPLTSQMVTPITKDYFPYVTKNQILTSIGQPEVLNEAAQVTPLYEKLGVGGIQAFTSIIIDQTLSSEQKIQTLMLIFKISKAEATAAVTGTEQIPAE